MSSFSQVPTTILNGNNIEDFIPFYSDKFLQPYLLPEVDIEAALNSDIKNGIEAPRFGIKIPMNLSKFEGETETIGGYQIWRISFYAPKAKSLNFVFDGINIPENAEIYIYNKTGSMMSGPIRRNNIHSSQYSSDIIIGNEVILQATMPKNEFEEFNINISNVIFGFLAIGPVPKSNSGSRDFGDALPCTVDIECSAGNGWEDASKSVALILVDDEWLCSGALLNTSCQELEGYFITAQHCVDGETGHLNWNFRFNYESSECDGDEPMSWLTYSGADVISQWDYPSGTDFGLLQLDQSVKGQSTLALAGWDRTDNTPSSGVSISHPKGDVKKIAVDYNTMNIEGWLGSGGTNFLKTTWDVGLNEEGSSGGPLFDGFSQKIVGISKGGNIPDCEDETPNNWSGRIYNSWTGGGTSTSRLSDWLGSTTTTSTISSPYIGTASPGPLCTTNRTYTLNNIIPNRTATWAVSPTGLFATTSGASTSGSGTSAVLRANSDSSSGLATLTFTISSGGGSCNPIILTYDIWVGKPGGTLELEDNNICTTEEGLATIMWTTGNSTMGVYSTVWTYDGPIDDFSGGPVIAHYSGSTAGSGYIYVDRTNACGTQNLSIPYRISDCRIHFGPTIEIYPNPTSSNIEVNIPKEEYFVEANYQNKTGMIRVFNKMGQLLLSQPIISNKEELSLSTLQSDLYILEVTLGEYKSRNKIMLIK